MFAKLFHVCKIVLVDIVETTSKVIEIVEFEVENLNEFRKTEKTKNDQKKKMSYATSYNEWKNYADQYDKMKDIQIWKEAKSTNLYDVDYIVELTEFLRQARENNQFAKVTHILRSNCVRNISNILNPLLYRKSYVGTKAIIEKFQNEYISCLEYIAYLPTSSLSYEKKVEVFAEMRHAFGRTALLLSGGAAIGLYHFGVVKTLYEEGLLPRIITGSSVGSIFASFVGTIKYEDLSKVFEPGYINFSSFNKRNDKFSFWRKVKRFFTEGWIMDITVIRDFVRDNIGDVTFQEAYDRTGWILNITATGHGDHDNCRLLNYLTSPNVLIWSAVCASCAIPYVFGPVDLFCKNEEGKIVPYIPGGRKFVDGSIGADLPMQNLSELFNVNCFMVSQTNPWVIPFMNHSEQFRYSKHYIIVRLLEIVKSLIASELKHRINQLGSIGILPSAVSRYLNLITQEYSGTVTIWPVPTLKDYVNILSNPNQQALQRGLILGSRRTYPKISLIQATLCIEKALDFNYRAIKLSHRKYSLGEEDDEEDEVFRNTKLRKDSSGSELGALLETPNARCGRLSSFIIPRTGSISEMQHFIKRLSKKQLQPK